MNVRHIGLTALLAVILLTACPSGELGERPVVTFDAPATAGTSENISIHFTITDADRSRSDVTIEYILDGLTWTPITVASSDVGTVNGCSVDEIAATSTGVTCTVLWDSWADGVGAAGDATVSLRLTPRDIDGVGQSVILPAPIVVNNNVAALVVTETSIDFGTRLARVPETPPQDILLMITNGSGVFDTFLYWEVTSDQPWLVVSAASGTTPAVPPYQSTIALTADVDGAALTASPTPYQATLTITGWNTDAGGADAYDSPVSIPVTVTVRDPEAEIFIHNGDGSTEVTTLPEFVIDEGGTNPAPQSFWVMNTGDEGSVLAWLAADDLASPDWIVGFETTPTGELAVGSSTEVSVAVDGTGLAPGTYVATITVSGTEKTSQQPAAGGAGSVALSLSVSATSSPGGAIAHWKLDESGGVTAADSSGAGNHAAVDGATWYPGGRILGALGFDGIDDRVRVPDSIVSGKQSVTVSAWVRTTSGGVVFGLQDQVYPTEPYYHKPALYVGADGLVHGSLLYGVQPMSGATVVTDGLWHHLALVGEVNIEYLYVDGSLADTLAGDISTVDMFVNYIGLGINWGTESPGLSEGWSFFDGMIDDVRVYDRALTTTEVQALRDGAGEFPAGRPLERVGINSLGVGGTTSASDLSISADGRFVAFLSGAGLVAGDTNNADDIFVHDRLTGETTRVSVASDGTQANGQCRSPSISADGRYVAFRSSASNLVASDTNGADDIFLRDRQTGQTTRVSVASDGSEANGESKAPSVSAYGRYVAFGSVASNLVPDDTNGIDDVFLRDRQAGQTTRVSLSADSSEAQGIAEGPRAISAYGRCVAFVSSAANIVPGDTNATDDIFVRDRPLADTTRVSVGTDGTQVDDIVYGLSISADAGHVAFVSYADLAPDDTNGKEDIYVRDRSIGETVRVSVATGGVQGDDLSWVCDISGDGRFVAFQSQASNLVPGDDNGATDVFVHDRRTGTTARITAGLSGEGNGGHPAISSDGRYVAFESSSSDLVTGDTNGVEDVFVAPNPLWGP